jgi:hypothetical protein
MNPSHLTNPHRSWKPTHEQYMQLLDKLVDAGLLEWLADPSGPKHDWRFVSDPRDSESQHRWTQTLEALDPVEQRVFDQIFDTCTRLIERPRQKEAVARTLGCRRRRRRFRRG